MEIAIKKIDEKKEDNAMEALFSCLDKGIEDMEAGRLHTVEDAFQIIRNRLENDV